MPAKLEFTITEDGTTDAQILTGGERGLQTKRFSAYSTDWESASISVRQTGVDQLGAAQDIPGAAAVTANKAIPVSVLRSAAVTVVCTGKLGTNPITIKLE